MKRHLVTALVLLPLFIGTVSTMSAVARNHEAAEQAKNDPAEVKAASSGGEGAHGEAKPMDTPSFILHHVSDDYEWEFEIPWPGVAHNPTVHLGEIFKFLQFEQTPGACAQHAPPEWAAFPGIWLFNNGCLDFRPTKYFLMMWLAVALLILTMWVGVNRDPQKLVPRGVAQNGIEVMVLFVRDEVAVKNIGKEEGPRYTAFLCTVFFFILYMNWLGLVPNFGSATGTISVTLALAIITFVLTQVASIRAAGLGGFLAHLTGGTPWPLWPIMIPVEILGLFTKPFALTIRLFANMLAGHLVLFFILALIFLIHPLAAIVSVPMATVLYFLEIFVGLLQAFIFTTLSALFIGLGVAMGHHGHEEHGHTDSAHAH
jgi:F-type H+-transporting ATPase subunit a